MGGQAGGWASDQAQAPGRPRRGACKCTMRAHTRWSGGLGGQMHRHTSTMHTFQPDRSLTRTNLPTETPHPAPLTPHPVPGILCFTHAPRTPHPTPSTLYPIGFWGPRTLDTTTRLCGGRHRRRFCMLFFVFPHEAGTHCNLLDSNYRLLLYDLPCCCQPTKNVGGERSRVLSDLVPPARMSPGWLTVLEGNNGM